MIFKTKYQLFIKMVQKLNISVHDISPVWRTKNLIGPDFWSKSEFFYHIDLIKNLGFAQKIWAGQFFSPPDKRENSLMYVIYGFSVIFLRTPCVNNFIAIWEMGIRERK